MRRRAIANERLSTNERGQVIYRFKQPFRAGSTHVVLDPFDFIAPLAVLVSRCRAQKCHPRTFSHPYYRGFDGGLIQTRQSHRQPGATELDAADGVFAPYRYLVARYSYFGEWYDDHSAAEFDGYGLADLLVQYSFAGGLAVALGAENLLNEYPDKAVNFGNGRKYPRYSPAGHNGALVYAKVSYSM